MASPQSEHPSTQVLRALVLGELSDAEAPTVEAHLAACETCLERLDELPTDSALERVMRAGAKFPKVVEPRVREWLDEVKRAAAKSAAADQEILQQLGPPQAPDELGTLGRYRILTKLGSGGMGCVFKALHPVMDRVVALKVMSRSLLREPAALARFHREIRAVARLQHPNIVQAHDADSVDELHFLVMEYVAGTDLRELVRCDGPLPIDRAADYSRQAALALDHAHARGMVHRDVKPANLMLADAERPGGPGIVKLLDLGLARLHQPAPSDQQTSFGTVLGTPDFLAPEQAGEPHAVDIRADIYSLGCTLYFLLAGRPPFPDGNVVQKIMAHQQRQPESLTKLRPDVPAELVSLVEKMMAKEPSGRFATPGEVAAALLPFTVARDSLSMPQVGVERPHSPSTQDDTIGFSQKPDAQARDELEGPSSGISSVEGSSLPLRASVEYKPVTSAHPIDQQLAVRRRSTGPLLRSRTGILAACVLLAGLAGATYQFGGAVYRFTTNRGQLTVEMENPEEIELTVRGEEVRIVNLKTGDTLTLRAGKYELELTKGRDGLRLSTNSFTLDRAGSKKVRVLFEPAVAATPAGSHPVGLVRAIENDAYVMSADYSRTRNWALVGWGFQSSVADQFTPAPDGFLVSLWDLESGQVIQSFRGHTRPVFRVALSEDNEQAFSFGDSTIRRWDIKSGEELERLSVGDGYCAAFSRDRRRALTAAIQDKVLRLWDLETKQQLQEFVRHTETVVCAAISEDGSQVLSGGGGDYHKSKSAKDYSLRLWNVETGEIIHRLEGHTDEVFAVAFSRDGRRALSGGLDGSVRLWDLTSGEETRRVIQSSANVYDVVWIDDQRCLASFSDGTVRLHDVETTEELHTFYGHADRARPIACSADGRYAISGGYDRTLRWWRLAEPDLTQPTDGSGPFVVLARDEAAEQKFSTLSRAVASARGGDTIEIHGNGPCMCRPIVLSKPLTVRAGAGYSPVLQLEKDAVEFDRALLDTTAPLVLEGLVFHRPGTIAARCVPPSAYPVPSRRPSNCQLPLPG